MRVVTAFLVTLLLLLGGGVVADAVLTDRAERATAELLSEQLDADVTVGFGGWPVLLHLLAGRVPEVHVEARDAHVDGLRTERLTLILREVRLDAAAALTLGLGELPQQAVLRADSGRARAEVGEDAVGELVGATVRIGDGQAQVDTPAGEVDVVAGLEADEVVLRPVGDVPEGVEPLRVEPPDLPGDARVTAVQLTPGTLRLEGELRRLGG